MLIRPTSMRQISAVKMNQLRQNDPIKIGYANSLGLLGVNLPLFGKKNWRSNCK